MKKKMLSVLISVLLVIGIVGFPNFVFATVQLTNSFETLNSNSSYYHGTTLTVQDSAGHTFNYYIGNWRNITTWSSNRKYILFLIWVSPRVESYFYGSCRRCRRQLFRGKQRRTLQQNGLENRGF